MTVLVSIQKKKKKKLITHKIWWSFQCADHNTSQTEDVVQPDNA